MLLRHVPEYQAASDENYYLRRRLDAFQRLALKLNLSGVSRETSVPDKDKAAVILSRAATLPDKQPNLPKDIKVRASVLSFQFM